MDYAYLYFDGCLNRKLAGVCRILTVYFRFYGLIIVLASIVCFEGFTLQGNMMSIHEGEASNETITTRSASEAFAKHHSKRAGGVV